MNNTGQFSFIIKNKTNETLFVDRNQSFWIFNGIAQEYFEASSTSNCITTTTNQSHGAEARAYGYLYANNLYYPGAISASASVSNSISVSNSTTKREKRFSPIPPNTSKIFQGYILQNGHLLTHETKKDFPYIYDQVLNYSENNSIMQCNNRIAYTTTEDGKGCTHVDNHFYLANVENYRIKTSKNKDDIKYHPEGENYNYQDGNFITIQGKTKDLYLPESFAKWLGKKNCYFVHYQISDSDLEGLKEDERIRKAEERLKKQKENYKKE